MITNLQKTRTKLVILHNIPRSFFSRIEESKAFSDDLFPQWFNDVFVATDLSQKFEAVYKKYKAIQSKVERDKIIDAFRFCNDVEKLCVNDPTVLMITLTELNASIRSDIDSLFQSLYKSYLKYHKFEDLVGDTIGDAVDRFIQKNKLVICPFCGIETYHNLKGESRLPLDHWLYKDAFPMASINFKNLIPIGKGCNDTGVKGSKNILLDADTKARTISYYPYGENDGINVSFSYVNEPNSTDQEGLGWTLNVSAKSNHNNDIFRSWSATMNIKIRYEDYVKKNILALWEDDYVEFVKDPDNQLIHADNIEQLRSNLRKWRGSFIVKGRPGAILYRSFITYLIDYASDAYLTGLCENLKRNK
jgi:hypothetical protein